MVRLWNVVIVGGVLTVLMGSCAYVDPENGSLRLEEANRVLIALAHPDDDTWLSGSLAKLAESGAQVIVVYATSGGAGSDYSGEGLSGDALSRVREEEAVRALTVLGVKEPPIFLRLPDGDLAKHSESFSAALVGLIERFQPQVLISFGGDGITGHKDHITVSTVAVDLVNTMEEKISVAEVELFQVMVSEYRAKLAESVAKEHQHPYRIRRPRIDSEVSIQVDVSKQSVKRLRAFREYKTQFPLSLQRLWEAFVSQSRIEEFHRVDRAD